MSVDVLVVGARCAGAPTAMLLARKGYRVLVLDRASFPSDTMSTHGIHAEGVACLSRWGLLERLAATGCPAFSEVRWRMEDVAFTVTVPEVDGVTVNYCPRRSVLDAQLVEAAREAGAEVREGASLDELVVEDGAVVGVRGRCEGEPFEERARVVVGADGRNSRVARLVGAEKYDDFPPAAFYYYNYFPSLDAPYLTFSGRLGGVSWPTHDGLSVVGCGWDISAFPDVRSDIQGNFLRSWEAMAPDIAEVLAANEPTERWVGTADLPFFRRQSYGPGWALVGDAGLHKDPITASGITEAWTQAERLVAALDQALSGRRSFDEALAAYQQGRDEHSRAWFEWTQTIARMDPISPGMMPIFASLAEDREAADRFGQLYSGLISTADFFTPYFAGA